MEKKPDSRFWTRKHNWEPGKQGKLLPRLVKPPVFHSGKRVVFVLVEAPWYRYNTRGCDFKIMKCETTIYDAMEEWLDNHFIQSETEVEPIIDPIDAALDTVRGQLSALQTQQENICEYLKKGICTIDLHLDF